MLQKKVCMLGSYGVGKTSLVSRFIHGIYHEKYQTTIGVKVDRKELTVDENHLNLMVWDLHGDDEFQRVRTSYLRGMTGYLLVIDGTRRDSLQVAIDLQELAFETVGDVPFLALVNKCDLLDKWDLNCEVLSNLETKNWIIHQTSAKTGRLVTESFELLARQMLDREKKD